MSRPVDFSDVAGCVAEFGSVATLITVSDAGQPHVSSVLVAPEPPHLTTRVGSRTRANLSTNPSVTLTWVHDDADYQLILDGVGEASDDAGEDGLYELTIAIDHGILHRVAGRDGAASTCAELGKGQATPFSSSTTANTSPMTT